MRLDRRKAFVRTMTPRLKEGNDVPSNIGLETFYPSNRDGILAKAAIPWLDGKRKDDDIGGKERHLWRVHDSLYDLRDFIKSHPGGKDVIESTEGIDITEAFEASHPINPRKLNAILKKYFVRKIDRPRISRYTFKDDGFYRTLKRKAEPILKEVGTGPSLSITLLQDSLLFLFLSTMVLSGLTNSLLITIFSGIFLGMVFSLSHNFFHQKPTWRMYVWDLSLLSSRDWRITHAFSHHLYTSTFYDVELAGWEPLAVFIPATKKNLIHKTLAPIYIPIIYALVTVLEYIKKLALILSGVERLHIENLFPIAELVIIWMVNGDAYSAIKSWIIIHICSSLWLALLPQIGTHRHPELYHPGDLPNEATLKNDMDWGVYQLDTGYDVTGKSDNFIIKMTTFGDHRLHHLFPTVDHSKLCYLYPVVEETCKEFGVPFETKSAWDMFSGHFSVMWKTNPRN